MLGNEAIARGLLENGCRFAASYPGTPASEILSSIITMAKQEYIPCYCEWSINEKVAFETALAYSYAGGRAAVSMKQVGLNVAADPLLSSAYTGVKGGFIIVSADDPGPHSSQTEQDSRMMAMMAKVPVLDPSTPQEAQKMSEIAYHISEEFEIPVMIRPTTRICHSRQQIELQPIPEGHGPSGFDRDPQRWAATPRYRLTLHARLNEKIAAITEKYGKTGFSKVFGTDKASTCIVSSGAALANILDMLMDLDLEDTVALYQVTIPHPLDATALYKELDQFRDVLVIEETYPVIELQLARRDRIKGRLDGSVPRQGELVPDVLYECVTRFLGLPYEKKEVAPSRGRKPTLCPGCPHRAAFYAIRKALPQGLYPSDIGCYTLGLNLGAVDTVLCMGAAISHAAGLYHAYRDLEDIPPIVATIGDSTFFHAGVPALINAVHNDARFILMILDNATTAMTGNQPTPQQEDLADGSKGKAISIEELVRAAGVEDIRVLDPYDLDEMIAAIKDADRFARSQEGGVSVIISRHPCIMDREARKKQRAFRVEVGNDCALCGICYEKFECPAIRPDEELGQAVIDQNICTGCGVCVNVCPTDCIVVVGEQD